MERARFAVTYTLPTMLRKLTFTTLVALCGCQALLDFGGERGANDAGPTVVVVVSGGDSGVSGPSEGGTGPTTDGAATAFDAGRCFTDAGGVVICEDFDGPRGVSDWQTSEDAGTPGTVELATDQFVSGPASMSVRLPDEVNAREDSLVALRALGAPLGPDFALSFSIMSDGALTGPTTILQLSFAAASGESAAVSMSVDATGQATFTQTVGTSHNDSLLTSIEAGAWYDVTITAAANDVRIRLANRSNAADTSLSTVGQLDGFAGSTGQSLALGFVATKAPHGAVRLRFDDVLLRRL